MSVKRVVKLYSGLSRGEKEQFKMVLELMEPKQRKKRRKKKAVKTQKAPKAPKAE